MPDEGKINNLEGELRRRVLHSEDRPVLASQSDQIKRERVYISYERIYGGYRTRS